MVCIRGEGSIQKNTLLQVTGRRFIRGGRSLLAKQQCQQTTGETLTRYFTPEQRTDSGIWVGKSVWGFEKSTSIQKATVIDNPPLSQSG